MKKPSRGRSGWLALITLAGLLGGCAGGIPDDYHDPNIDKNRSDFNALREPPQAAETAPPAPAPAVPQLAPVLSLPPPPELSPNPRVTVSATEDTPLKDVLFELARQAGVEIEIDPRIEGGILFSARNRRFLDIIKRISVLAGLRYSIDDNVVRVEVDEPYQRNYPISYVSLTRQTTSRVAISTELTTPGAEGGGGGSGGDTSSSSVISGQSTADLYGELLAALEVILANTTPRGFAPEGQDRRQVVVHRQAGIVSVFGTARQHEAVETYLGELRQAVSAQVLIEAKVVEINLRREYSSGVDWRVVLGAFSGAARFGTTPSLPPFNQFTDASSNLTTLAFDGDDFGVLLNFVESFGTTRTLSSPRLTVMNNQTAVLKVAENQVFFELDVERDEFDADDNIDERLTIDSQIRSVPIGFVMAVQPSIDLRESRITLTLRPTITRVTQFASDPAVAIVSDNTVESLIPVVETREVDSVLELNSGELAVLGGLMQDRSDNQDTGLPGLSEIPWVGRAFKSRSETSEMVELVVFLRARILRRPEVSPADLRLYRDYMQDPRPLPEPRSSSIPPAS